MRFYSVLLVFTATLLANTKAFSTIVNSNQENGLTSTNSVGKVQSDTNKNRYLRGDTAIDEERIIKIPIIDDVTEYLNQLTLKYWLQRNKDPKEVWGLLRLNGLKGRAHLKPRHRYYLEYLTKWNAKKAATNIATTT